MSPAMIGGSPRQSALHLLWLLYVIGLLVAFFFPVPAIAASLPSHTDKLVHLLLFLGFAVLHQRDRHTGLWHTIVVTALFAGAVEIGQSLLPYRSGDFWDWAAGSAGGALGAVLGSWRR